MSNVYKEKVVELWKKSGKYKYAGISPIRYTLFFIFGSFVFLSVDQSIVGLKKLSRKVC